MDNQPLPSPPSISSPIISPPPSTKPNYLMITLLLLVFLLLSTTAFFAYQYFQNNKLQVPENPLDNKKVCTFIYAPVCGSDGKTYPNECEAENAGIEIIHQGECDQTSSTTSPFTIPTDWETYTNSKYGFEFNYPKTITLNEVSPKQNQSLIQLYWNQAEPYSELSFQLSPMTPLELISLTIGKGNKEESIDVNGISAIRLTGDGGIAGSVKQTAIYFTRNKLTYYFFASGNTDLLDQILSTFKFIDQNQADISDWKTYTNKEYGFEFKYPKNAEFYQGGQPVDIFKIVFVGEKQKKSGRTQTGLFDGFMFTVSLKGTSDKNTIKSIAEETYKGAKFNCFENSKFSDILDTTINNKQALSYTVTDCLGDYTESFVSNDKNVFGLTEMYVGEPNDQVKYHQITNQILSTFKFLN